MPHFLLFIAFLRNNFPEKSLKFSKTAPSAPNLGALRPKSCPPIAKILGGQVLQYAANIGGQPPATNLTGGHWGGCPPNIRRIVLNLSPQYFGDWGGARFWARSAQNSAPKAPFKKILAKFSKNLLHKTQFQVKFWKKFRLRRGSLFILQFCCSNIIV